MSPTGSLRIAWLGSAPAEVGGAPGIVTELLEGLAKRGHRLDCFFPGKGVELPDRVNSQDNLTIVWGTNAWQWNRWYSRGKVMAFTTGLLSRAIASVRLRREVTRRHRQEPYDLIFQNQTIESLAVPTGLARSVPLVIRPDTQMAGELRCLLAERQLSFRCQPRYIFFIVVAITSFRALVQRAKLRRASLLICISAVFRDHTLRDYRFPREKTVVVQNPVKLEALEHLDRPLQRPPVVLMPARISVRKGIEDVVALARLLLERGIEVQLRVVGGPSLWSDYTKLLDDLPAENSEYVGPVPHSEMPAQYAAADVMLLASKFDPCPMAVLESLAAGVPVVATSEVGSIESVDREVAAEVSPGDVEGLADALTLMLDRLRDDPGGLRAKARAEAERLFAPDVICDQISLALERLVHGPDVAPGAVRSLEADPA